MTTAIEYALMAGGAYISNRDPLNQFPAPQGWQATRHDNPPDGSGFEAISFINGTTIATSTEIVISFAGTDGSAGSILTNPDKQADAALAAGLWSDQLGLAAAYYLEIKATAPANATISFTGHSLGGGLASLLSVFFGEAATTFDQAPFKAALVQAQNLKNYLLIHEAGIIDAATLNKLLAPLDRYITAADPNNLNPIVADTLAARQTQVLNFNVQGELLSTFPYNVPNRIGTQSTDIPNSTSGVSADDLHAQSLLAAYLQSNQTAAANKALNDVTYKLTDLLKMIFDPNLFAYTTAKTNATDPNFLEHLVRHQTGGVDGVQIGGDGMVTRFTADLWKLAQDGGLTLTSPNLSKVLTAFAMQKYYEEQTAGATLFSDVSGGIQFDMADVSTTFRTAFDSNQKLNLSDAKGFEQYFKHYLKEGEVIIGGEIFTQGIFTAAEQQLINSLLPYMRDWYIQAGASGMNATDTLNRGAFMLGGSGSDALVGGTAADLLVGNAGDDLLMGEQGNDHLLGGLGNDTYVYQSGDTTTGYTGDGLDTILDSDGNGSIVVDGVTLAGGAQYGDGRVHKDANGHLYVDVGQGLAIDGNMLVLNYQPTKGNGMGLTMSGPVADINPVTTRDIYGDLTPDGSGDRDILDNLITSEVAAPDRVDYLYDSEDNDHIMSGGGDDYINADRGGDDLVEAGAGRDKVYGGEGKDVIAGGTEGDLLSGGIGDDRIYADVQISVASAVVLGNTQVGTGLQGDWLSGGEGEDALIGSASNDVLTGGNGTDLLIGGAGDDDIGGDAAWSGHIFDWTVTTQNGRRVLYGMLDDTQPTVGAADIIYAGEGKDYVWSRFGNDVIFGEGGDDVLGGGGGNDIILGGAGKDVLYGDNGSDPATQDGNDYLDGSAGEDDIFGQGGDDILIGGAGIDTLDGGAGHDTYLFNRGDGRDWIYDGLGENNTLRFGVGISSNDITLNLGSLKLNLGNGDEIHIANFDRNDVFNSSAIIDKVRWRTREMAVSGSEAANDIPVQAWRIAA